MTLTQILFYLFATVLVLAALRVVTCRNPVHAALFLVLSFVSSSALWMLIHAEFLAIGLILIYVGAVMVLFLFVVMMLNIDLATLRRGFWKSLPVAAVVAVLMVGQLSLLLLHRGPDARNTAVAVEYASNSKELGRLLFRDFYYPFELAAVLLLIAIIAAIALTLRRRKDSKYLNPADQIAVKAADRMDVVKMPFEPDVDRRGDADRAAGETHADA